MNTLLQILFAGLAIYGAFVLIRDRKRFLVHGKNLWNDKQERKSFIKDMVIVTGVMLIAAIILTVLNAGQNIMIATFMTLAFISVFVKAISLARA